MPMGDGTNYYMLHTVPTDDQGMTLGDWLEYLDTLPERAPERRILATAHADSDDAIRLRQLPNGKLPDRSDFIRYAHDVPGRRRAWNEAALASRQLAEEFAGWLENPGSARVDPL